MKPILSNTEMVRALLDNHKTVTRRVVKPQPPEGFIQAQDVGGEWFFNDKLGDNDMMAWWPSYEKGIVPPYRPGDILYVRETWQEVYETEHDVDGSKRTVNIRDIISNFDGIPKVEAGISHNCATATMEPRMKYYVFKASDIKYADPENGLVWRPSIHMPREAARIFLRVKDVTVERLRDITEEQAQKEGLYRGWTLTEKSTPALTAKQAFMWVWDRIIKPADHVIYGWAANPWVWVIEFERCEKPEEGIK